MSEAIGTVLLTLINPFANVASSVVVMSQAPVVPVSLLASDLCRWGTLMETATGSIDRPSILSDRMCRLFKHLPDLREAFESPGGGLAATLYLFLTCVVGNSNSDSRLLTNAIYFPLSAFPHYSHFDAFPGKDGSLYLLVDFREPHGQESRIVPMRPILPYPDALRRQQMTLDETDMLPVFFVNIDQTVGFPLMESCDAIEDKNFNRSTHTSLKVRFAWPNYPIDERQVQFKKKSDRGIPGPVRFTVRRLASLVAGAVRTFMEHAENRRREQNNAQSMPEDWVEQPRWRIGEAAHQITVNDVLVLGIYFASPGAVVPILKVRDSFVFIQ